VAKTRDLIDALERDKWSPSSQSAVSAVRGSVGSAWLFLCVNRVVVEGDLHVAYTNCVRVGHVNASASVAGNRSVICTTDATPLIESGERGLRRCAESCDVC